MAMQQQNAPVRESSHMFTGQEALIRKLEVWVYEGVMCGGETNENQAHTLIPVDIMGWRTLGWLRFYSYIHCPLCTIAVGQGKHPSSTN